MPISHDIMTVGTEKQYRWEYHMTLFEALMPTGKARSTDNTVLVVRRAWENQHARGQYYRVYRHGYADGIYNTLFDVLRVVRDIPTLAWESAK